MKSQARLSVCSINQSNCSISVRLLFLFCSRAFISRSYENRSIEVQLLSTREDLSGFSVLRYPNHFLLASVQHCLELKRHHYPNDSSRPVFKQIESFFSGILSACFDCKYFPLYARELLGCLLGILLSGRNPCGRNEYFRAEYTTFFTPVHNCCFLNHFIIIV